jgi:hypothetical protein
MDMPRTRRARRRKRSGGRSRSAAEHCRNARHQRFVDLLRADEMDVRVDATCRDDHSFAGDDLGRRADHDVDPGLDVGISRLAEPRDLAVLDRDVAFDDAPPVDHQRIGDHRVGAVLRAPLTLPHTVADHLAAAELHFLAVHRHIALDLDDEIGVGEANAIARRRTEHFGVGAATDLHRTFRLRGRGFVWSCAGLVERSHHCPSEALDDALSTQHHELHRALLPGLEANRRARRDVEAEAARAARSNASASLVSAK